MIHEDTRSSPARKQPQDTVAGCRERAAANMVQASEETGHSRSRLELSADTWSKRADMLQRIDESFQARLARAVSVA